MEGITTLVASIEKLCSFVKLLLEKTPHNFIETRPRYLSAQEDCAYECCGPFAFPTGNDPGFFKRGPYKVRVYRTVDGKKFYGE